MNLVYEKSREFIYKNARPIDLARWQFHFENGTKEAVLNALAFYQNEDGGFGHALEADTWNPNSAPIQTWTATEILREMDFTDNAHPIIKGILRYLENGKDFDGKFWYNAIMSNNDYPHAPWWHIESDNNCGNNYNPTACLAGFILRFADKDSELYRLGCRIAREAFEQFISVEGQNDMHTMVCYVRLMQYCEEARESKIFELPTLKAKLHEVVKNCITQNISEWETSYICKPSQFFNSNDSIFYFDSKKVADYECQYIVNTQLEDGSWNILWGWSEYPNEWAISKNWWKSNVIIINMLYLRGFGKF